MHEISPYLLQQTPQLPSENRRVLPVPANEDVRIHLQNYWQMLKKRLQLILLILLGTVLATAIVIFTMTPTYTAKTVLLIERQGPRPLNVGEVVSPQLSGPDEYDYYRTQYEILRSEGLAARVIVEQSLEKDSYFSSTYREGSLFAWWSSFKTGTKKVLPIDTHAAETKHDRYSEVDPRVIEKYQRALAISPVQRTRLVAITFSTPFPALSARLANNHAETFIRQGAELRNLATEEARNFLEGKLGELKKRVEDSESALNRYRQQRGILSLDDRENVVVGRLVDLNKLLTEAEAERIGLEAQVRLVRKRAYDALPAVLSSTLIQTLRAQLTNLEGEYASLAAQFKPGFPRLDQLKAQVDEMRNRLSQEVQKVVAGIESTYLAADAKESELRVRMEAQKTAALNLKDASVEYAILSREVDTNRQLYDSVLQRIKEIGISTDLRSSNITVLDKAIPPLKPSTPKKTLSLLLGSLLGLMGGVGFAFALEFTDNTIKSPDDVQRHLLLPNLAVVPDFLTLLALAPTAGMITSSMGEERKKKRRLAKSKNGQVLPTKARRRSRPSRSVALVTPGVAFTPNATKELAASSPNPFSVILESYRSLRTAIFLSRAGEPPKTVLFTSGTPGEGKSVTALNTAIVLAQTSTRVLLIDADLRHASCHKLLGIQDSLGLTELLTGQRDLDELVQTTSTPQLFLLSGGGSVPPDPAELLGSRRMQEILTVLQGQYDYILIDSPPVIPVSDALILSTMVDGVILVINSQKTPRYIIKEAQARLDYARAKVLGVVLNKMNMQTSDYAHYYGDYLSYYPNSQ